MGIEHIQAFMDPTLQPGIQFILVQYTLCSRSVAKPSHKLYF